jgi:prevent-host-death family protein
MVTVNIHEAKTQLSKLIDQAVKGEAFMIAKAGKPLVKVAALDAPPMPQRLGFLAGEIAVPEGKTSGPSLACCAEGCSTTAM